MRAVVVERHGGPDVLVAADVPEPRPGPTDVLVQTEASGINFIDTYHRSGHYPMTPPFVPGVEGVGTVLEVGSGVDSVAVGDRVGWVLVPGSYADRVVVPVERVVPIPEAVPSDMAAASLLQGITGHYLTNTTYRVRPGDAVLVHAAAGGMGLLLTQLVKLKGGTVIGTVSTAEKEKLAREAGADEIVRYTEVDVAPEVRRLTGGDGVAVVYDGVGSPTFDGSLASLRRHGVLVQYGQAGGSVPPFDLKRLADAGSVFLTRPALAHHVSDRAELLHRTSAIFELVASGRLGLQIGTRYPLPDAARAHRDLEGRRTTGKSLLLP